MELIPNVVVGIKSWFNIVVGELFNICNMAVVGLYLGRKGKGVFVSTSVSCRARPTVDGKYSVYLRLFVFLIRVSW